MEGEGRGLRSAALRPYRRQRLEAQCWWGRVRAAQAPRPGKSHRRGKARRWPPPPSTAPGGASGHRGAAAGGRAGGGASPAGGAVRSGAGPEAAGSAAPGLMSSPAKSSSPPPCPSCGGVRGGHRGAPGAVSGRPPRP